MLIVGSGVVSHHRTPSLTCTEWLVIHPAHTWKAFIGTEQFVPLVHREVPAGSAMQGGRTGFPAERPTTSIEPLLPTSAAAGRARKTNGSAQSFSSFPDHCCAK